MTFGSGTYNENTRYLINHELSSLLLRVATPAVVQLAAENTWFDNKNVPED